MVDKIKNLIKEDIFFITPDVKRGIGLEDILPNYHIICAYTDPIIPVLRKQSAKIFCLAENVDKGETLINNSGKLLQHPLAIDYIKRHSRETPWIMYFKPSLKLDLLIKKRGYLAIGNSAELNENFENKINFYRLIREFLPQFTLPSQIGVLGKLEYKKLKENLGLPFVIQFGHGWAGKTTFLVDSEKEFKKVSCKFPNTLVKVSKNINGLTFLNNCCIYKNLVFVGPAAIQLSGIKKLCSNPSVTCGRQWPAKFLTKREIREIYNISQKIGKLMEREGFKGFFGLDFLVEDGSGKIYVSETNARLTASTSFYTRLEKGLGMVPLLIYHIASFLEKDMTDNSKTTDEIIGSQVIFRKSIPNLLEFAAVKTPSRCPPPAGGLEGGESCNTPPTCLRRPRLTWRRQAGRYGVFKLKSGKPTLVRKDYFPEKLSSDEFIYMSRLVRDTKVDGEETARIEAKREVLDGPQELKSWLERLIILQKKSPGIL